LQLNIIQSDENFDALIRYIERYFNSKTKVEQLELSIFEQYRLYPGEKKFIPEIWKYRILCKNNLYYFGTI